MIIANKRSAFATILLLAGTISGLAQQSPSLPGGASSLQETYEDWRVMCAQQNALPPVCSTSQTQVQKNGQRVLSIDLAGSNGSAKGNLILPFGLLLEAGVSLQANDEPMGEALPFKTCLPAGCIVPVVLDSKLIGAMSKGGALKIQAKAYGKEQAVNFQISLKGFSNALDRANKLSVGK